MGSSVRLVVPPALRGTKEVTIWKSIHARCIYKSQQNYRFYGGKGIKVCERWSGEHGLENFIADMGRHPGRGMSLDRIDPTKDYSPDNCRWIPMIDNIMRACENRSRAALARTHCKYGHEFTDRNIKWVGNCKVCKTCELVRQKAVRAQRKEHTRR